MEKPTRRNLLKAAAIGGVTATGLSAAVFGTQRGLAAAAAEQSSGSGHDEDEHGHDDDGQLKGKRALAVVNFGQWDADPARPHDRQPITNNRTRNIHDVLPYEVEIEAGGAVSFIISGVHQILVYGPGSELADVQAGANPANDLPGVPTLVNNATNRVYRGLDPRALQYVPVLIPPATVPTTNQVQDRVESLSFPSPGRYLVVCGVRPHFNEGMHGFVNVREAD